MEKLLLSGTRRHLNKGQVFQSTDGRRTFNLLYRGYAKRYMIGTNGNLSIQVVYGPGDIFPITLVFDMLFDTKLYEGPEVFYYEPMCPIVVYSIDDATLAQALKGPACEDIYKYLLLESSKRLHSTLNGLENLGTASSYHRVAHQLAYYAHQFSEINAKGEHIIQVPLTHQDIADILSITRETASISMSKLKEHGLIRYIKRSIIVVPDLEMLTEEAYGSG